MQPADGGHWNCPLGEQVPPPASPPEPEVELEAAAPEEEPELEPVAPELEPPVDVDSEVLEALPPVPLLLELAQARAEDARMERTNRHCFIVGSYQESSATTLTRTRHVLSTQLVDGTRSANGVPLVVRQPFGSRVGRAADAAEAGRAVAPPRTTASVRFSKPRWRGRPTLPWKEPPMLDSTPPELVCVVLEDAPNVGAVRSGSASSDCSLGRASVRRICSLGALRRGDRSPT